MVDIDFSKIAPRGGSLSTAFEDLCCQLAARIRPLGTKFDRYHGAGGDGGVECKTIDTNGSATGWQAKYVFDIDGLLKQVQQSLKTALSIHDDLTCYVVCFPFNLTGKTGRRGKSQTEKFDEWARKEEAEAKAQGRILFIERRSAHDIKNLILENDPSGGLRYYFFSETTFSDQWFVNHVASVKASAGPRYNREISLETPLSEWFSSFGERSNWKTQFIDYLDACRKKTLNVEELVEAKRDDPMIPKWPEAVHEKGKEMIIDSRNCIREAEACMLTPTEERFSKLQISIIRLLDALVVIEGEFAESLKAKYGKEYGKGVVDSKGFRSYMAAYQITFPAANLDVVRDAQEKWRAFSDWLASPSGFLAFRQIFVLSGIGGAGKTHSLCDTAQLRLENGAYTCVIFGHQFSGEPDPWTRLAESLGIPLTLGREGVLDALEAAAECSGKKLVICIDAVNETRPRSYWYDRIAEFAVAIISRSHLKLCVSCRTSFLQVCLPKVFADQAVEHKGFAGMEREAGNAFFAHYGLEPPLMPVLQPELANPLYLRLVCETLQAKGLKQLPKGWFGIAPVIRAFLIHKENQFAVEHNVSPGAAIVSGSLRAIAAAIAESGNSILRWSEACSVINAAKPQAKGFNILQWLITADLLIEDGPSTDAIGAEHFVRPAFDRFGDFLVASDIIESITSANIHQIFQKDGKFAHLLSTERAIRENTGLLAALSVLLPEKLQGIELSSLVEDDFLRSVVTIIVVQSLPWRTTETFSLSTQNMLKEVLRTSDVYEALDAMMAVSTQRSKIDALWFHEIMRQLPWSKRDAVWCTYLKQSYEKNNIVRRIIEAVKDIDLQKIDNSTAELWCIVLFWFCAAADRRVKDFATRTAITILRFHSMLLPKLVNLFLMIDDDEVRERMLLVTYGALIHSRDQIILKKIAEELLNVYMACPEDFQNAIIRDHIRCIAELARYLDCLDKKFDPTVPNQRNPKILRPKSPSESEEKAWKDEKDYGVRLLIGSCLYDDFNHYSINCLYEWNDSISKSLIGRWIVKRVLDDFGYRNSKCSSYDSIITRETGGGRGKPTWAERIGKKYQWIAMYQLGSRLYDSTDRKKDSWKPTTGRLALILNDERKLDPTISQTGRPDRTPSECWWIEGNIDLSSTKQLDYTTWVNYKEDLPSMEIILAPKNRDGQRWLPLICYPAWSEYRENRPYGDPYRSTWIHLEAFLVPEAQFDETIKAISGRNFHGDWMPKGADWIHVFTGEYPWATTCNTETDDWHGFGTEAKGSTLKFIPVSNEIVCDWEYDGSLSDSMRVRVPARVFFESDPLWWNGLNGFLTPDGKTVFCDPSVSEGGPSVLIADIEDLLPRLEKLGYRLIWTLLGEKYVLGEKARGIPYIIYSQTAYLNKDGTFTIGERVFFDKYDQDQGLAK